MYEKALGPEHLHVGIACNVLALCMMDQVTLDRTCIAESFFVAEFSWRRLD